MHLRTFLQALHRKKELKGPKGTRIVTSFFWGTSPLLLCRTGTCGCLFCYDPLQRKVIHSFPGSSTTSGDISVSRNGEVMITQSHSDRHLLWDIPGRALLSELGRIRARYPFSALNSDGSVALTNNPNGTFKVTTGTSKSFRVFYSDYVLDATFNTPGTKAVILFSQSLHPNYLLEINVTDETCRVIAPDINDATSVLFNPENDTLLVGTQSGKVYSLNTLSEETDNPLYSRLAHMSPVVKLCFSDDGTLYATADKEGNCFIWNNKTSVLLEKIPLRKRFPIKEMRFSPDKKTVLITGLSGVTYLYYRIERFDNQNG